MNSAAGQQVTHESKKTNQANKVMNDSGNRKKKVARGGESGNRPSPKSAGKRPAKKKRGSGGMDVPDALAVSREPTPFMGDPDEERGEIQELFDTRDYHDVMFRLECVLKSRDPSHRDLIAWAKKMMPVARRGPTDIKKEIPALTRLVQEHLSAKEYDDAIEVIEAFPARYRSEELREMHDRAIKQRNRISNLRADAEALMWAKRYTEAEKKVISLLKTVPDDEKALGWYDQLVEEGYCKSFKLNRNKKKKDYSIPPVVSLLAGLGIIAVGIGMWIVARQMFIGDWEVVTFVVDEESQKEISQSETEYYFYVNGKQYSPHELTLGIELPTQEENRMLIRKDGKVYLDVMFSDRERALRWMNGEVAFITADENDALNRKEAGEEDAPEIEIKIPQPTHEELVAYYGEKEKTRPAREEDSGTPAPGEDNAAPGNDANNPTESDEANAN